MSLDTSSQPSKICPTCGTRLSENATRCLVCGRVFTPTEIDSRLKPVQSARMPELTISLPIALGMMVLILAIGAGVVFFILKTTGQVVQPTMTSTITLTMTITQTPSPSMTSTPPPTATPLPPFEYTVKEGDLCSTIAGSFNVSINSIVVLNNLAADCGTLYIGQKLFIPQPTPTASPMPSATLGEAEATEAACEKIPYTVKENDTLSTIAANYNVPIESLKSYNGLSGDIVFQDQTIIIPLCARRPTAGPTPTPTLPPPYPAPNLLLPADGEAFMAANDTITLQWDSVGTFGQNEYYMVTVEDVTEGKARKLADYVTDTKFIVPSSFRPAGEVPHVYRWWVSSVRQVSSSDDGEPVWDSAGATSMTRVFTWWGANIASTSEP